MTWTFTDDVDVFLAAAGPSLAARPVEHTVALSVTERLRRSGAHHYGADDPVLGWWRGADGAVAGTLVRTPPHGAMLTALPPEAVEPLVEALGAGPDLDGVNADRDIAALLAARLPGYRTVQEQRLYRLGTLRPPSPAPEGRARAAAREDRALLVAWVEGFAEATGQSKSSAEWLVDEGTERGSLTLWESGGTPVALAGRSLMLAGMVRVTSVYTPPEFRGRGYGAAVTAESSRAALAEGAAEVLLFTDLANPTSNGVYLRIGYEPVADRVQLRRDT
ncbi:acetyltransferase [Streptomyces sp. TSRI0445]|uniref:Acetyltransferase, GNAT family n=1 Tax=Streptomyces globisporus TaxID=1908 RepID=A0ABM9GUJ0_STRGL|nr:MULTISPECIES: GNAT family N-acetyltransferase [Streptomyces]PPA39353.1 GNAT family N-acetyltransferase [Streptomyces griseus]RAN16737.1 acetyltransferase [Streptomyces badius]AWL85555.1 N-acetyltransferase [Streptomyces globisporus]OKI66069.1 acetyltransferase [Streptomyces sp. TSRI0445]RAN24604.1 acetyltransferase [Streptomyces badius]